MKKKKMNKAIIFKGTNVCVKILKKIDDCNYVIRYGDSSIISCKITELLWLN
jgi:hypothetical protein